MNSKVSLLPLALTSLLLAACGGGGGGDNPPAQTMGTLGVSITDASLRLRCGQRDGQQSARQHERDRQRHR